MVRATLVDSRPLFKVSGEFVMGKGDRRTRRGKIYAGSFGKSRPKAGSKPAAAKPAATAKKK
jgi:30S ribosomal protein S31